MLFTLTPQAMPDGYGEALVPLADAKAHLNVLADDFDNLIAAMRDAAIDAVERYTGLYLAPRTGLVATFAGFGGAGCAPMRLGKGPIASLAVTAVSYVDGDGASVALDGGVPDWRVLAGGVLAPAIGASWPSSYGDVTVTFSAGFADGAAPPMLLAAAKLFLGTLFANREHVVSTGMEGELPFGFRTLCDLHRIPVI